MNILLLTAHFKPNIGGVETHLSDLCKILGKKNNVSVLTYRPLQTDADWKMSEKDDGAEIIRIPWIPNLFYKFIKIPLLEFIYLVPGLFIVTPFVLFSKQIDTIHAHGLVAGFVGVFWGKLFQKRIVISTHSIYNFPKKGLYKNFVSFIFNNADSCLGLSEQAVNEIKSLCNNKKKVKKFTYWIDLNKFRKVQNAKAKLHWENKFIVLFVGRLVEEKGVDELLESAKLWNKNIYLTIIGSGPLEFQIKESSKIKNVEFLGAVDQDNLPLYYSGSDILVVPSVSEEGFGRVILEALACGVPIIGANRGGVPEAIDQSVGKLIDINPESIKQSVEYFYNNKNELKKLAINCRDFAERRYSEKNADTIIEAYK